MKGLLSFLKKPTNVGIKTYYDNFDRLTDRESSYINPKSLKNYSSVQYVAQCVDKIVSDVLSQQYAFYNRLTGEILEANKVSQELVNLLYNYNDMRGALLSQILLNGNAYILKKQESAYDVIKNQPSQLQLLRSDKVTVNMSTDELEIQSYVSGQTGKNYAPQEIIHFKQTPIYNGLVGVGNIEKILKLAQTDLEQQALEYEFMNNRGLSPYIVAIQGNVPNEEDQIRAKRDFDQRMNSKEHAGKAHLLISDGNINVHSVTNQNIKEMLPIERDEYKRDQILSIFGVPQSVLGIRNSSQQNTDQTQEFKYYRSTINPKIQYLDDVINSQLIWKIDPKIEIRTKKISVGDSQTIINQVNAGLITPNRGAELLGEEANWEDESRNMYYMQSSLVPMSIVSQPTDNQKKKHDEEIDADEYIDLLTKSNSTPKKFQLPYVRKAYITKKAVENKYTGSISDFYRAETEKLLEKVAQSWDVIASLPKKFDNKGMPASIFINIDEHQEGLSKVMRPLFTSLIQRTLTDVNSISGSRINIETSNPLVASLIRQLGSRIRAGYTNNGKPVNIGETTRKEVEDIITNAVNKNLSLADVQEQIAMMGEQWAGPRSRLIARTEISKAHDFASHYAYQELGVKSVDVVGCTQFESYSDCGKQNIDIAKVPMLVFHPNHIGTVVPSKEP